MSMVIKRRGPRLHSSVRGQRSYWCLERIYSLINCTYLQTILFHRKWHAVKPRIAQLNFVCTFAAIWNHLGSIILFNYTFWDSVPDRSLQWSRSFLVRVCVKILKLAKHMTGWWRVMGFEPTKQRPCLSVWISNNVRGFNRRQTWCLLVDGWWFA